MPAGASGLSFTLEFDAMRQTRGHGKLTYSYCFTLYRVLSASRWSLPLCGKLADTVSKRTNSVERNTVFSTPAGASGLSFTLENDALHHSREHSK